jgi:hypothetical protein
MTRVSGPVLLATEEPTWEDRSAGVGAMESEVGGKRADVVTASVPESVSRAEWWCDGQERGRMTRVPESVLWAGRSTRRWMSAARWVGLALKRREEG